MPTHGMWGTRFYRIWKNVKQRSTNEGHRDYVDYGGRGVGLHPSWESFENFKDDMYQDYLKHVEEHGEDNTSLDRVDNDGNYEPSNCRWATRALQEYNKPIASQNTSGVKGVSWYKKTGKWRAFIKIEKKYKHLGLFETIEEAAEARLKAERMLLNGKSDIN